jgi:hypothetical protein
MNTPITVDSWQQFCDSIYWADEKPFASMDFRGGQIVFCKIDEVMRFFEKLRLTRRRVILVTRQGCLPCDVFRQKFLPGNVAHWFATNVTQAHPRITALPLGLGSPSSPTTLTAGAISEARRESRPREKWLYVNFRPETNPAVRGPLFEMFQSRNEDWVTFQPPQDRGSNAGFLGAIMEHRFVLCPPGNGVDTHRMWEVLLAGAIPVVLRSQAMTPFESLPILFVDDYREVTQAFLQNAWTRIRISEETSKMLFADYWGEKIAEAKQALKGREQMGLAEWMGDSARYGVGMIRRRFQNFRRCGRKK